MKYKSKNEQNTLDFAAIIAKQIPFGSIILLSGDLGAGKTTFVKGVAKELNIKRAITSPTFTILKTYEISPGHDLIHVDAYRLENSAFDELEDYITDDNIVFIEWSNFLTNQELFKEYLAIDIRYISKNQREFNLFAQGQKYQEILNQVIKCINYI